jgi:hypothetical protein
MRLLSSTIVLILKSILRGRTTRASGDVPVPSGLARAPNRRYELLRERIVRKSH